MIEFATNGREERRQAAPSSVENLVDPGRDSSAGAARSRTRQAKLLLAIISIFRLSNAAFHPALDHGNRKPIAQLSSLFRASALDCGVFAQTPRGLSVHRWP